MRHGEDDGWLQDWEKDLLDQQQVQQQHQLISGMEGLNVEAKPSGGGKKKKNKKITLMSTANGARRGA